MNAGIDSSRISSGSAALAAALERRRFLGRRGQAMVEFAMVAIVAIFLIVIAIQYALIGQAALALSQAAFAGARYLSVNSSYGLGDLQCYLTGSGTPSAGNTCGPATASPTLTKTGYDGSIDLTMSISPTTTPRSFGQTITVTLTFDTCKSGTIVLGNHSGTCSSFLGLSFPTTLTATETAMGE
jgi:Flp pilus assembly protein TadG